MLDRIQRESGFRNTKFACNGLRRTNRARCADRFNAARVAKERLDRPQLELGCQARLVESRSGDLAVREKTLGHRHTPEMQAFKRLGTRGLAEYEFGAATTNIHDEPKSLGWWQAVRHAVVDEPRFFDTGDDFDRVT